ncbi:Serine-aspartate repeat-containing protein F OS=Candidatus Accumulibacter sp. BA-93 GN=sdrF PE=4 SV=1: Cna_B: Cna_B: Cna_B: Cna_B: Cna_B: Cna_B: Cna_B: Cna_B: Cna_B: Cna_B: Cna_B: Cna_B: Cna_B: Cna_B: Cna_B: Cna_B [Gemmata massiliana]|uniref:SD-repeat containing protein B domain-containing protein n=1 Tax=Gemmata massiliana TaxID=1210884 RepID=A0A6P2D7K8_9BACT|nr:SdrD B-like domain-containing protein [Gemmata massiliana]VTR96973.1 Serine-aspartate repeat-containing protein F OS=Candidatus Accumulibacter sp. BA-93 GN=sdrF PE=4 SV=1: Cna_B: Cna_B: Cna_B: Cna_B: Cna_B: Cna_B: Cna_B: Cna_B: Cna_B: Cna_B: Cna_B: Cna_B: Cna_B: Cna_B: Cna_B: Cna_B [Gemmata massiliana]
MTPTWKTFLSRLHSTISGTGRRPIRTRRPRALAIEQLEDRLVPAFALQFSTNGGATFSAPVTDQGVGDTDALVGTIGVNIGAVTIAASSLGSTGTASTTLNLSVTGVAAASAHDIIVRASLSDLTTTPAPQTLVYSFTGSTPSGGTVTSQTWVDDNNALFGMTGDTTGAKTIPASGSLVVSDTVPYSATTQIHLVFKNTFPINLSLNNLNTITASPEQKAEIHGTKFEDVNGNGVRESSEAGLQGWTIQLLDTNDNVLATTLTAVDGSYSFTNLTPGIYRVREVNQAGWTQITANPGDIGTVSGSNITGVDFGNFKNITIAGTKYTDITGNSFSSDDTPLAGITVNLFKNGALVATTTTATDGTYSFANQGPGNYFVQELVPTGYQQTGGNAGYTIVATSGLVSNNNNFDNFQLAKITGKKVNDLTGDGLSSDDTGLGGVTVNLYKDNASGVLVASTTTAADGTYSFDNLAPGTYFVQELVPAGSVQTAGNAGYTVTVGGTGVQSGGTATGNDFANFKQVTITGTKFTDITGNSFSSDDTPRAGVTINLYQNGNFVTSTVTGADGTYKFENLGPGTYFVQELVPAGATQTGGNAGYTIAATSGLVSNNNNFDNFYHGQITGKKVTDLTGNGLTSDDTGLGGVTVNLYKATSTLTLIASTVTAADGTYSFGDLDLGTYFVQELVPSGYVQTGGNTGYTITVGPGGVVSGGTSSGNDFANFQKGSITGTKYTDITGNGLSGDDTELGGVTINLYSGNSTAGTLVASTVTAANGTYSFGDLAPGTYFVQELVPAGATQTAGSAGYVVVIGQGGVGSGGTSSGNNFANFYRGQITGTKYTDVTGNGITGDDTGLGGVTINLYKDNASGALIATTTTASDGTYSFGNLDLGTYFVQEIVPAGSTQTAGIAGYTITVGSGGVASGGTATGNNFANFKNITIAGTKYTDITGNSFSSDDTPLAGITVNLFKNGALVATTTTATDGTYSFANQGPGNYFVQELVPTGYQQTGGNAGYTIVATSGLVSNNNNFDNFQLAKITGKKVNDLTGDGLSSDDTGLGGVTVNLYKDNASGVLVASTTTAADGTYSFDNLAPGTYCVQELVPAGSVQTAGNAGYTVTVGGTGVQSGGTATGNDFANFKQVTITGTKFTDITGNSFSSDDTPRAGVTINLYQNGNFVTSTVTGADGTYKFENLGPGTYFVQELVPAGATQTGGNAGYTIAATSGLVSNNNNFDNFYHGQITGKKVTDLTGNGLTSDDTGLGGVTINLYSGGSAAGAIVATTTTAANGTYSFSNLAPGTYFVQELVPAGYQQTAGNAGYVVVIGQGGVTSGGTSSGNDFANFQKITISGTKYNDITGNSFSADDTPLAGVTINLFKDGGTTPVATTVTGADGTYSFTDLAPGTYFVQELVPAGSVQTGGNAGYTIAATSGLNSTGNNFDNFKKVSITGTKVTDKTGNGFTSDDAGLGGITINLYSGTSTAGALVASTTTASNGTFSFSNLAPGTYFVQEVVPSGYVQTTGTSGYAVTVGGTGIQSGGTSANNNFANFQKVKITGTKFQDMDGCGFGSDDVVLGGVTIKLYSGTSTAGALVASTVTAANGTFSFEGLAPGTYFVQEVVPTGWTQTGGNAGYVVTVGGTGVQSGGTASGKNFDNYKKPNPGIDIEKTTNGPTNSNPVAPDYDNEDAVDGAGVPILTPGSSVTWTYKVTNTGDVAFTTSQIAIVDDNGTPGVTSDDLSIANGKITFLSVLTGDSDNLLEPGEVWLYKATGIVQDFSVPVSGSTVSFDFSGNSAVSGTAGNVRTFTSSGVSVNASAFSRDKTTGAWSTAYLGSYGGGLGVTDTSESGSSNSHTVDNSGRDNYVLFEFSENVVIDSAFLGYVVGDSDLTVWIGTKTGAFNSHLTLSDSVLASLGFTEVNLGGSSTRTANLNAALLAGNVLVIAAKTGDSDDNFKIETLCLQKVKPGVYENKATVTVPGASDSDLSHYKNPPAVVGGSISGTKYLDVSGNGLNKTAGTNSPADTPLAGVTIYLDLDNDGRLDVGEPETVTDANGNYLFTGLASKTYYVREVVPAGFVRTGPALSDNYAVAVSAGKSYTGYDFANAETCEDDTVTCVSFTIRHTDGTCETVTDLRGRTREGDLITVTFNVNVPAGQTHQITFVSYTAPGADFDANTASQQKIYDLDTDEFGPGYHTLTVRVPNCYYQVDFVCGFAIDKLGPANSNIFYTPQKRLVSADNGGAECCDNDGMISGYKFNDADADGVWDNGEKGLSGWVVYLDSNNNGYKDSWETATVTDANGYYKFNNLAAGNYRVREVQQSGWVQSAAPALVALTTGQNKTGVNFGNVAGSLVSGCDTASIDFWNCSSGQSLIKSLNGGSTKTALGTWLASNFSKLYGSSSSYNLSGKTNAQVASYFQTLAGKSDKLEAQILATALAVYVTDSDLAGGTYARNYGFKVTTTGIADEFYNIGTNGSLFGVANGGVRTVWQILVAANNSATSGLAWNGNSTARSAARTLFAGLNDVGGIG